jgi:hypothetical protein
MGHLMLLRAFKYILWSLLLLAGPSFAATCSPATSGGTAPSSWPTYCWLDFSTYNDTTAQSAGGQNFTINLTDGSVLSYNVKVSTTVAGAALNAVAAPSWTGSAVGNTAFLGIPNKPILYSAQNASVVTVTISNIVLTPPAGATAASSYMFVAADAESTNNSEALQFTTNGGSWTVLDQVPPISGNTYPPVTNTGSVFTETGVAGTVGGYIVGSTSPTTVTTVLTNGGLQGTMYAVRFASITLNTSLVSVRPNATDQFTYSINVTSSGSALATATSTGTGNGPYGVIGVSLASGLPFTVKEVMASGSTSTLLAYSTSLSCTNSNTGSSTVLPVNSLATSYAFPTLNFGDAISCNFVNTPFPIVKLSKALAAAGRVFTGDQFVMNLSTGGSVVATTTTTGTGATITNGTTAAYQARVGSSYTFTEAASGTTILNNYAASMTCANAFTTSSTTMPTTVGGTLTPALGDSVTCTITNTAIGTKATLQITKVSSIISDPINGTTNPRAIPGAVIQYLITVTNIGTGPVDSGTVIITDPLPTTVSMYVSGTPVTFTDGSPSSGLALTTANVTYSKATGGGTPFSYTPVPNGNGYDSLVTGLRIAPTGIMSAATTSGSLPYFTLKYLVTIK